MPELTDEQIEAMAPQQRRELIIRLERPVSDVVHPGMAARVRRARAMSLGSPLGPRLGVALRRWRDRQGDERQFFGADYQPGDYVLTFEDSRPPHPETVRQRFDRLAAAAGLSRITFHDLRHSYATGALKAGVSHKLVSERIEHGTLASSSRHTPTSSRTTTAMLLSRQRRS